MQCLASSLEQLAVLHTDVVWELYTKKPMSHKHRLLKIISEWIQGKDPALKSINIRFVDVRPRSDIKLIRIKDETNV